MRSALALLLLLAAAALSAQEREPIEADRPGIADGSRTVGRGVFQAELGVERDHVGNGYILSTPLLLRYGLSAPLELRVEGDGYNRATSASGWAPLSIGVKYHVLAKPSLGVIARYFPPSGSGALQSEHPSADLRLTGDVDLNATWSLNPNAGVTTRDDGDGRFTAALAALTLQDNVTTKFNVFVDGALQKPEARRGRSSIIADTGAAWILGTDVQLDVEIGWGARGRTPPNVFLGAGISRRF